MIQNNHLNPDYGLTPENPVLLRSITASRRYLEGLMTSEGLHLFFHRKGSLKTKPVTDHYELVDTRGNYCDIYICIYNRVNIWVPPSGFAFGDNLKKLYNGNPHFMEEVVHPEDILDPSIQFYEFKEDSEEETEFDLDAEIDLIVTLPRLELIMDESLGVNYLMADFPFGLIRELVNRKDDDFPYVPESHYEEYYGDIKPRE